MHCPVCGDSVEKVHRHPLDRFISVFYSVHRYQCSNPGCGWEGTLHRDGSVVDSGGATSRGGSRLLWFVLGAATLYAGQQAVEYYFERLRPPIKAIPMFALYDDTPSEAVAKGEDDTGEALELDDPRVFENRSSLKIRKGCAWGVPGSNPYKGSVTDALVGTKIPQDVIRKLDYMAQRGLVSDRLKITNTGITTESGERNFGQTAASMAFGDTLCFNTRVNFRDGHIEKADLYEATDSRGQGYAIMIPYACNNVSVLAERKRKNGGGGNGNGNGNGSVPEPSVWIMVALGLVVMLYALKRRL